MKNQQITVISISDPTGTYAPSAGANGALGPLALKSQIVPMLYGATALTDAVTTITHATVNIATSYPLVTLAVPTSASLLFVQGITNRTTTSFDAIISSTPTSGYILNWAIITN
jgi:hypothetical protein